MKICIISSQGYPCDSPRNNGGVQEVTEDLAREFVLAGHEVHVLARTVKSFKMRNIIDSNGVIVHFCGVPHYAIYSSIRILSGGLQLIKATCFHIIAYYLIHKIKPDVVHCQDMATVFPAYISKSVDRIPYIVVKHSSGCIASSPFLFPKLFEKHWNQLPFVRAASRIIALTNSEKKEIDSALSINSMVIPNGVNTAIFHPANAYKPNLKKPCVLCVSRVEKGKGLDDAIDGLKKITQMKPDVKLCIVGSGSYLDELKEYALKIGVVDSVEFIGVIEHDELNIHYQKADIFLMPSHQETFSLTLLEASAAGLPIISTSVGFAPDLIGTWNNGVLVPAHSPDSIAKAVIELLSNENKLIQCYNQSLKAAQNYSWGSVAESYLNIYSEIFLNNVDNRN